jgi:transcriptional regulator with XRE-family HTH domain
MHANPIDVPATMRAARRKRRVSQRELAALAGVPRSTVERIEAGTSDPRTGTLAKLLTTIGVELHACVGGLPLQIDPKREELVDVLKRHLPPHWEIEPVTWLDDWWGWWRKSPQVRAFPPAYRYWKPRPPGWGALGWLTETADLAERWADAT